MPDLISHNCYCKEEKNKTSKFYYEATLAHPKEYNRDPGTMSFPTLVKGAMDIMTMHFVFLKLYGSREEDFFLKI